MTFRRSIVFAFVFLVGLLVGAAWKPMQPDRSIPPQPISETAKEEMSIPELVANQLKNGDLTCPNSGSFTYEACLLYQGALGTWQRMGLPEICPAVVDENSQPPLPKEFAALTAEDALRAPRVPCFGYLYAIQVANTVPLLISTPVKAFKTGSGKPFLEPGSDPDLCIEARHGICGNQAAVGVALFEKIGLKARPVEFYYYDKQRFSHIIPEVFIDGDWRLVDTTYGAYWVSNTHGKSFQLKTLDDLLGEDTTNSDTRMFYNSALLPVYSAATRTGSLSYSGYKRYFKYLTPNASILRGGKGAVIIPINEMKGIETFGHLPNYIGDNKQDGENLGVTYKLDAPAGKYSITVEIAGSSIGGKDPIFICIDKNCTKFSEKKKTYRIAANNPSSLYLKSEMDVAYIVLASIEWEMVN